MKILDYKKQMFEFIDEVNKVGLTKDRRQMILLLGIYSEYLINELLRIRLPKSGLNKINSQSIKLKILLSHSILTEKTYRVFYKLNQVRNEYAHNLLFKFKKIKKWASETPLNWKMDKQSLQKAEDVLRKDIFDRFEKICISNIIFLFQNLGGF